ncbi:hypothetical protein CAF53_02395 [Sphingobium sp. LB126]|uniref:hypothetical protein n=1 Tax=Sphingobium sp. LB126 TaxID=1983755 RepID=UPI000C20EBD3|nr:hypothetical protein [Sphingobium sp. LB126]PJG47217.1 hypothetical protein CAF53_02395 [Sphingobium sp. LB126]
MDEDNKRRWDVRLGVIAPVLTILGILVGVWEFNHGENSRRVETENAEKLRDSIAFRRTLWQQKLTTYQNVTELAGRLAATKGEERAKAYVEFRTAYWGAMVLVEDPEVEKAMIAFDREYRDQASGWSKDDTRLMQRADILAKACRTSLATGKLEGVVVPTGS